MTTNEIKERQIRATFDENTITIYQAYNPLIALPAIKNQTFVSPFKMERMTWIKPSFLWMMYRSGWGSKKGQECILAIKLKRSGWEWALRHSCLSHFDKKLVTSLNSINSIKNQDEWKKVLEESPVRIQWDPEKDIFLKKRDYRSIQVGLSGIAVEKYINEWIVSIEDISEQVKEIYSLVKVERIEEALALLPKENVYPLPDDIKMIVSSN